MPDYLITHFGTGVVSTEWGGRVDSELYQNSSWEIKNAHVIESGAVQRRGGTKYLANTKGDNRARLIPFIVSATEGRVVEVTNDTMRFYEHDGQLTTGGSPVELTTTGILETDGLANIRYVQTYDGMRLVNGSIAPVFLARTDDYNWSVTAVTIDLTTNTVGIPDLTTTANYPSVIAYHQDRVAYANTPSRKDQIYMSQQSDYDDFQTSATPTATEAIMKTVNSKENTVIQWLGTVDAFMYGDQKSIWMIADRTTVLTGDISQLWWPTPQSEIGASFLDPIRIEDSLVFLDSSAKKLRKVYFEEQRQRYMAEDITIFASDLIDGNIVELHYQRTPRQTIWALTDQGTVLSMAYNSGMGISAWSSHDFSGTVESMCIIPSGGKEWVFLAVNRTVDGSTVRFVEEIQQPDYVSDYTDAWFVDAGIEQDSGDTVVGSSMQVYDRSGVGSYPNIDTPTVTFVAAHGLSTGDLIRLETVPSALSSLEGGVYEVVEGDDARVGIGADPNKIWLGYASGDLVDITSLGLTAGTSYSGTPNCVPGAAVITGLTHLEGEEVDIFGDGSVIASETVASGQVTADEFCNKFIVGLPTTMDVRPVDIRGDQNKRKRIHELFLKVVNTTAAKVGPDADNLSTIVFREGDFSMDDPPELLTGNVLESFKGDWEYEGTMLIRSDTPTPMTLLSVIAKVGVGRD